MLVDYWIKPWVLFQEGLVGHHYQWYAMVNHCLALVVSTHSITQERKRKKERERERERERHRRKAWIVLNQILPEKMDLCKCWEGCGSPPCPRNDPRIAHENGFCLSLCTEILVFNKLGEFYHMHNNKNRRENYLYFSYANSFSSLLLKEKLIVLYTLKIRYI